MTGTEAARASAREDSGRRLAALTNWAAGIDFAQIPAEVRQRALTVLADDLAAMIGARDEPEVRRFHDWTLSRGHPAQATVWRGGRARTDRINAAVANAVAADWLELDEGYRPTPCHAGLYVIPALLAEAEASDLRLDQLIRALVLGYEIVTRIASSWSVESLTMQSHGRYSAVGAAAATALASGADGATLFDAVTAAATLIGPAPRNHLVEGALVRNVWPAVGAFSGMMAVQWAGCGIAGTAGGLEDVYGMVLGGRYVPGPLDAALGRQWALLQGYTKVYACCQHLHSAVEATLQARSDLASSHVTGALRAEDVEAIIVEANPLAAVLGNQRPGTTLAAKFSLHHAVAAAVATGSGGADAFAASTLAEPAIDRLRQRVQVRAYAPIQPPPADRPARVTLRLAGGREVQADCPSARGGPDRPLPADTWATKMRALAEPVYPGIVDVFEALLTDDDWTRSRWREVADRIARSSG